jgi:ABC-type transport system involved in multi-copper enzyme maturation permease subunit
MIGPILSQELLLGSRRSRQMIFRRLYTGWLVVQVLFTYWILYRADLFFRGIAGNTSNINGAGEFARSLTDTLIVQQLVLILLATPAYAAGAITDEKTRGTLQFLFAAAVTSWEIILGKLLGRVIQVGLLVLATLPMLCAFGVFAGMNLLSIVGLFAVTAAPLLALGAVSLLASVWSRQTRDAVLGVYICGVAAFLVVWATGYLYVFNPLHTLEPAWGANPDLPELTRRLALSVLAWSTIAVVCLGLAVWRLRPAYFRQLQGDNRPRKARWWLARRTAVPDEPIRWKERHVEGIAPLASLRQLPRWLGLTLIAAATVVSSLTIIGVHLTVAVTPLEFGRLLLDPVKLIELSGPAPDAFYWQAVAALALATLLVGVRCSGAVTGERERQTWEALLLTPLPVRDLIRGKLWGIIGASHPYLLAYAVPAVLLSMLGGPMAFLWTVILLAVTYLGMAFMGAAGLWCSVRFKTSWGSLLVTLMIGYLGGFILWGVAFPVAGILFLIIYVTLLIVDLLNHNQTQLASLFGGTAAVFFLATYLALLGGFLLMVKVFLGSAQKYVADRERIRHWKDEPRVFRPRRRRLPRPSRARSEAEAASTSGSEPGPQIPPP